MALKIALDTNRYVDFCKGDEITVTQVKSAKKIFLPYVVLAELRAGFLCGAKQENNTKILSRFLNSERVEVLYADDQTTHHYAKLFLYLKTNGTPIPTNDLWIASLIIQHDLILSTNDSHFKKLPQIATI